jgi:hypothetical protein
MVKFEIDIFDDPSVGSVNPFENIQNKVCILKDQLRDMNTPPSSRNLDDETILFSICMSQN